MTHEDLEVNKNLVAWFQQKYGNLSPLTVHRGEKHDYLGMTLTFSSQGHVRVAMADYIRRMLEEAPDGFFGEAATPEEKHLFDVDDHSPKLEEHRANIFHNLVARTVFLGKQARPDVQLAVGFLSTRLKCPDEGDSKKLRRMVQYLRSRADLVLTLEGDDTHILKWWADAAFAVHGDIRSQSGAVMSMGKGALCTASTRQNINTKSSTEADLVGVNDFMPQVLRTGYFLEGQGYEVRDNLLFQDNQSSILLEKNGKGSRRERTLHINIQYFFTTDLVRANELSVKYCTTDDMLGEFFTKPLQGSQFKRLRDAVLNIK